MPSEPDSPAVGQAGGPARVPIIGLTGGVGSGKSSVARAFESLGCWVSDSDVQAQRALEREDVKRTLTEWWGGGVLDESGRVDRSRVASIVFDDPDERRRLEGLIHPLVHEQRAELAERAAAAGAPAIVLDAPLLLEAGLADECDVIVFVEAPDADRLNRVRARGWSEEQWRKRESAQMPLDEKRSRADLVIPNPGAGRDGGGPDMDRLRSHAASVLRILGRARGGTEEGRRRSG